MKMEIKGVKIEFLGHSGFLITNGGGKRIAIDPYNVPEQMKPVDLILITHSHYDHCSLKDLIKLSVHGTVLIVPADVQSKITRLEGVEMQVMETGDEIAFKSIKVEAVPAYNINKDFHTKADGWHGYVLKMEGVVVYHAGDSDFIPEMKKLSGYGKQGNEFIVMLPISGTYTMTAEEAAEAASIINPTLAIPMHYGAGVAGTIEDAQRFVKACKQLGVEAAILEKLV
jgi:L-ascorbate metabolism protein UlaG (beta-lactamase superfamily)